MTCRSSKDAWARGLPRLALCAVAALGLGCPDPQAPAIGSAASHWRLLEPGLDLGSFSARSFPAGPPIRVLRVDPSRFELKLLNASGSEQGQPLTAREWCKRHDLVAAINSSMYQEDLRRSVSLMRTRGHTNNPRLSKDMTVLAFDRRRPDVPPVRLIDRECEDFDALAEQYDTLIQSIRMVSCKGQNVWSPRDRRFITAAIGLDRHGRVLFLHSGAPYTTHEFINLLLELPIDLDRAMYAEGGLEAQLYVGTGEIEYEFVGMADGSTAGRTTAEGYAWPIPNVVGVARRVPVGPTGTPEDGQGG